MHRTSARLAGVTLCLGTLLVLPLQAEEPQKKISAERDQTTGARLICDVGGSLETWGSSEYGYPYADRTIAMSPDGRWLAFPFVESTDWWVNLCDLTAPLGSECPRWRQGYLSIHSPVVAGPNNTVAFLSDDPYQREVIIGKPETYEMPREYIRVCWCGTGKSAFYLIPQGSIDEPRPRSRSRLLDLWFTENPVLEKPILLALLFNGTLCIWTLPDNGLPPKANVLMVEDKPRTLNLYDLVAAAEKTKKERPDEFVHGLFAVAHRSHRIALCNPEQPTIRIISYASGNVQALQMPKNARYAPPYQDLLLSENGRYCVAFRPANLVGRGQIKLEDGTVFGKVFPDYPNVLETWNAETGKQLWQHTLPDRFFVSRAAFNPDGSRLVTWSCVGRDLRELINVAESDEERQRQQEERYKTGVLQLWNAATGKPSGTLPFPAKLWIQALSFSPDGKQVVVLEHGGACQMIETTAFTSPE